MVEDKSMDKNMDKFGNTDPRDAVLSAIENAGWLSTDDVVEILSALYVILDEHGFTSADIDSIPDRAFSRLVVERSRQAGAE